MGGISDLSDDPDRDGVRIVRSGRYIFIRKDASHRYFKLSVRGNILEPLSTNLYPDSTAVAGDKVWVMNLPDSDVQWLYSLQNTGVNVHRLMLI